MARPYHDAETLDYLYNEKGLSAPEIANRFGVSSQTIYEWMDKHSIERNTVHYTQFADPDLLNRLYYEEGLSVGGIADKFGVSSTPIRRAMKECGLKFKSFGEHQTPNQLKNAEWLKEQNHNLGKTIREISDIVGCSPSAVNNAFDRHGIKNKYTNKIPESAKAILKDKGELKRLYIEEGLSTIKIGNKLGVHEGTVSNWLHRHDIETRSQSEIEKELHPRYKPEAKGHVYDNKWAKVREIVIERDGEECQKCGISRQEHQEKNGLDLDVHHIIPQREIEDKYETSNLTTMCRSCHIKEEMKYEAEQQT